MFHSEVSTQREVAERERAALLSSVLHWAVWSRVVWAAWAVAADVAVEDYDTSSRLAHLQQHYEGRVESPLDALLMRLLRGFSHWDGVYFVRIALEGYEFEQVHAFFPLLPLLMALLRNTLLLPLSLFLSPLTLTLLSGVLISNGAFVLAALDLFRLGLEVVKDKRVATLAALLFCIAPSTPHMVAIYSESLYAFLSFRGLLLLTRGHHWAAVAFLSLTSLARSTGWTYGLFFLHRALLCIYRAPYTLRLNVAVREGIKLAVASVCLFLPLWAYQYAAYRMYCVGGPAPEASPWCEHALPDIYRYVQARYWNVGFLRYYTLNNIPNFALAAPVLGISAVALSLYAWSLLASRPEEGDGNDAEAHKKRPEQEGGGFLSNSALLPFMLHWAGLLVICVTVLHVQVSTRFLSATAPLYWAAAAALADRKEKRPDASAWPQRAASPAAASTTTCSGAAVGQLTHGGDAARNPPPRHLLARVAALSLLGMPLPRFAAVAYTLGYAIVGCALFANFYPWT
eukprot:TRINITY_DN6941_c0_g1_i1.p1 TRINITY_DN6941_c0_g1~~TRINITY_DN6941_c0_g1_i1.p1  ORF type:complete len:514 (-),score=159.43 TRINITY_DN6941_c0_g1_i1:32-1573(-)